MKSDKKNSILTTQNLSIGYSSFEVAHDLNLTAQKGKLISIIGKNGSGKSTLIRTLTRIQDPLKGSIILGHKNINHYKQNRLAREFALVLTEKLPENLLTVSELIAMGRQTYTNWLDKLTETDKEKIDFALEMMQVRPLLNKKFIELSDGQQQRVLIAKAIAQDTPLIYLDEPTAHLDVHHRMETFLLLKELTQKYDKTILMATHEIGLSVQMADELWLVHNKAVLVGSPEQLIADNSLATIFNSDLIRFNPKTSTFEFR